jgi:hypothetical protein
MLIILDLRANIYFQYFEYWNPMFSLQMHDFGSKKKLRQ